ncbi:MAG: glycosyltransferase family 9 protein [Tissierellia bacterium]|nr:glycosyltransferase family 9 protein [Tissierellia bacterium]
MSEISKCLTLLQLSKKKHILIIAYSAFGDIVQQLVRVRRLKECYPDSEITWLACAPYRDFLKSQPFIDQVFVWDRSLGILGFLKLLYRIRKKHFDVIIDLKGTDRSLLMVLFSRAALRIGWHSRIQWGHTFFVKDPWKALKIEITEEKKPFVFIPQVINDKVTKQYELNVRPFVTFLIGASKPEKCWPITNWIALLNMFSERKIYVDILIMGHGTLERNIVQEICAKTENPRVKNLVGELSFIEMAAVMARSMLVVGGDTGPSHLAEMLGVPLIGLFGPTDPKEAGYNDIAILRANCKNIGCQNWSCPLPCMETISPLNVFEAISSLLRKENISGKGDLNVR